MKGTQSSAARQVDESGLLKMMLIQIADHVCHSFVIVHADILPPKRLRAHPLLAAFVHYLHEARPAYFLLSKILEVLRAVTAVSKIVTIFHDELTALLGGDAAQFNFGKTRTHLVCGT
jgi:hypothetical protein